MTKTPPHGLEPVHPPKKGGTLELAGAVLRDNLPGSHKPGIHMGNRSQVVKEETVVYV